jgi:hypothetical protein
MAHFKANFNTGLESIQINDNPNDLIWFNAHDMSFPDKFKKFCDWALKAHDEVDKENDANIVAAKIRTLGDEICLRFNGLFGKDAHAVVFKGINPITPTFDDDGGMTGTLVTNFLTAITPYIESKYEMFDKLNKEKAKEYTDALSELESGSDSA